MLARIRIERTYRLSYADKLESCFDRCARVCFLWQIGANMGRQMYVGR